MANGTAVQAREKESFWRRLVRGQAESGLSIRGNRQEDGSHPRCFRGLCFWRRR